MVEMDRQILVRSLNTQAEEISLSRFLEGNLLTGRITGLQLASESGLKAGDLARVANEAFGSNILPVQITINESGFDGRDLSFAKKFGCEIIPHFASLKARNNANLKNRVEIEAWTGPALVSVNHPLTQVRDGGTSAMIITEPLKPTSEKLPRISFVVFFGFGDVTPPLYLRLTALDEPSVLGQICGVLGDNKISIKKVEQPEPSSGSTSAEIALILAPAQTIRFENAKKEIDRLSVCQRIETVLPVVG